MVLFFLGAGTVLVAVYLPLPYGLGGWLAATVLASLVRLLCLHVWRCMPRAIRQLKLHSSGVCAIIDGVLPAWQDCRVTGWFVHPWLVILRLQVIDTGRRRDVLVARGALSENRFRELRVCINGLRSTTEIERRVR